MNTKTFKRTSALISAAFYLNDDEERFVSHEVAHALLLFGRVCHGMDETAAKQIDAMSTARANDHEMRTCALQLHAHRALHQKISARWLADQSWAGLVHTDATRKYRTRTRFEADILAAGASPMLIGRFVRIYRDFSRYV